MSWSRNAIHRIHVTKGRKKENKFLLGGKKRTLTPENSKERKRYALQSIHETGGLPLYKWTTCNGSKQETKKEQMA